MQKLIALVIEADLSVQLIMLSLLLASILLWAIILKKRQQLLALAHNTRIFLDFFKQNQTDLTLIYQQTKATTEHPLAQIFRQYYQHYQQQNFTNKANYINNMVVSQTVLALRQNLNILAIMGSAATFVGLLGTVIGIISSFQAIAVAKSSSLAIVAPGIAEALLATALGLMVAIPAMVAYNWFNHQINLFLLQIESFTNQLQLCLTTAKETTCK